jgi:hypothetical protein
MGFFNPVQSRAFSADGSDTMIDTLLQRLKDALSVRVPKDRSGKIPRYPQYQFKGKLVDTSSSVRDTARHLSFELTLVGDWWNYQTPSFPERIYDYNLISKLSNPVFEKVMVDLLHDKVPPSTERTVWFEDYTLDASSIDVSSVRTDNGWETSVSVTVTIGKDYVKESPV